MALGSTQPLTEMSTRSISWGQRRPCVRLTTYHHPVSLSRNLGALTSWNPLGLSRSVMGLLYLYLYLRLIDLYQWQHLVIYERQESAYRQWQLNLCVLILQNFPFTPEIKENHFTILRKHTVCIVYFGWFIGVWILCTDDSEHSLFHLHSWCTQEERSPCVHRLWRWNRVKFRRRGNHPTERIQHSEQGKNLKSTIHIYRI